MEKRVDLAFGEDADHVSGMAGFFLDLLAAAPPAPPPPAALEAPTNKREDFPRA